MWKNRKESHIKIKNEEIREYLLKKIMFVKQQIKISKIFVFFLQNILCFEKLLLKKYKEIEN